MTKAAALPDSLAATCFEAGSAFESRLAVWLAILGSLGLPLSLLWDYSWDCTIGVDLFWSPPHVGTFVSVALALLGALMDIKCRAGGAQIGKWTAPVGSWMMLWGCGAFLAAVSFDRWWQGAYGLSAGIWHPPQICKALAFFVISLGVCARSGETGRDESAKADADWVLPIAAGGFLCLIAVVNITASLPNRQHSGWFYEISCASYPVVLFAASVVAGSACRAATSRAAFSRASMRERAPLFGIFGPVGRFLAARRTLPTIGGFGATKAALVYTLIWGVALWVMPLFPAKTIAAPVYNPMSRMMPPSFPLLLIIPAMVIDSTVVWCNRVQPRRIRLVAHSAIGGLAFAVVFLVTHWFFSEFLLSNAAAGWIFAGGGRHWPFFFKISDSMRQSFWISGDELNESSGLVAVFWSICSAWCGCWLGTWMRGLRG